MLKALNIDVYFEEQNIHTMSADGELMLTILASYAQEESRSASENQLWRVKKNFEAGKPWRCYMLGYRLNDGQYYIVDEEAEVVRRIYREYLDGSGCRIIANRLNEDKVPTMTAANGTLAPLPQFFRITPTQAAYFYKKHTKRTTLQKRK